MSHLVHTPSPDLKVRARTFVAAIIATLLAATALSVFLVVSDDESLTTPQAPATDVADRSAGIRYDGGPDEGRRATMRFESVSPSAVAPATRYDGGPDEGRRATMRFEPLSASSSSAPAARYDGGPEEGTRGIVGR